MQLIKYKLGDLIVQRREKNKDYDLPIRGVSKEGFIKPKVEEADTSIYNVFYKNDFVFNPARMELNSIALNLVLDKALCSSLYEVFYVKDENVVLPEFLNLHIKRDEFARHCDYIGLGSAREYCRFANIAEFDIKIPSIEVQREIVQADRQIKRRIRLNEQMIEKLEATAQALYRKMFVDGIDKENLPEGWRMGILSEVAILKAGGDKPTEFSEVKTELFNVPIYANGIENKGIFGYTTSPVIKAKSITISARGTIGYCFLRKEPYVPIVRLIVVAPHDEVMAQYLYHYLDSSNIKGSGSVQSQLTVPDMEGMDILIPPLQSVKDFNNRVEIMDKSISIYEQENSKLSELQSLLLAKMGNLKQ
jgi:type I restriction enzyme S subunit